MSNLPVTKDETKLFVKNVRIKHDEEIAKIYATKDVVSVEKNGLAPKLPGDAEKVLNGKGAWTNLGNHLNVTKENNCYYMSVNLYDQNVNSSKSRFNMNETKFTGNWTSNSNFYIYDNGIELANEKNYIDTETERMIVELKDSPVLLQSNESNMIFLYNVYKYPIDGYKKYSPQPLNTVSSYEIYKYESGNMPGGDADTSKHNAHFVYGIYSINIPGGYLQADYYHGNDAIYHIAYYSSGDIGDISYSSGYIRLSEDDLRSGNVTHNANVVYSVYKYPAIVYNEYKAWSIWSTSLVDKYPNYSVLLDNVYYYSGNYMWGGGYLDSRTSSGKEWESEYNAEFRYNVYYYQKGHYYESRYYYDGSGNHSSNERETFLHYVWYYSSSTWTTSGYTKDENNKEQYYHITNAYLVYKYSDFPGYTTYMSDGYYTENREISTLSYVMYYYGDSSGSKYFVAGERQFSWHNASLAYYKWYYKSGAYSYEAGYGYASSLSHPAEEFRYVFKYDAGPRISGYQIDPNTVFGNGDSLRFPSHLSYTMYYYDDYEVTIGWSDSGWSKNGIQPGHGPGSTRVEFYNVYWFPTISYQKSNICFENESPTIDFDGHFSYNMYHYIDESSSDGGWSKNNKTPGDSMYEVWFFPNSGYQKNLGDSDNPNFGDWTISYTMYYYDDYEITEWPDAGWSKNGTQPGHGPASGGPLYYRVFYYDTPAHEKGFIFSDRFGSDSFDYYSNFKNDSGFYYGSASSFFKFGATYMYAFGYYPAGEYEGYSEGFIESTSTETKHNATLYGSFWDVQGQVRAVDTSSNPVHPGIPFTFTNWYYISIPPYSAGYIKAYFGESGSRHNAWADYYVYHYEAYPYSDGYIKTGHNSGEYPERKHGSRFKYSVYFRAAYTYYEGTQYSRDISNIGPSDRLVGSYQVFFYPRFEYNSGFIRKGSSVSYDSGYIDTRISDKNKHNSRFSYPVYKYETKAYSRTNSHSGSIIAYPVYEKAADTVFTRTLVEAFLENIDNEILIIKTKNNKYKISKSGIPTASSTQLGGVKINGNGLSIDSNGFLSCNITEIPTASSTQLGGVKINGNGLSIDSNGFLSCNITEIPTASSTQLGGIKVGDGLSIDNNGLLKVTVNRIILDTVPSDVEGSMWIQD